MEEGQKDVGQIETQPHVWMSFLQLSSETIRRLLRRIFGKSSVNSTRDAFSIMCSTIPLFCLNPKKDKASKVKDFRPIDLITSV